MVNNFLNQVSGKNDWILLWLFVSNLCRAFEKFAQLYEPPKTLRLNV